MKDVKIECTPRQIKDFIGSLLHKDYNSELDYRLKESFNLLLIPEEGLNTEESTEIITHDMIRGRIKNLKEMKTIFEDILGISIEKIGE